MAASGERLARMRACATRRPSREDEANAPDGEAPHDVDQRGQRERDQHDDHHARARDVSSPASGGN